MWKRADVESCLSDDMVKLAMPDGTTMLQLRRVGWVDFLDATDAFREALNHAVDNKKDRPMARQQDALRDWHRLFGLLLTDYFTDTPFTVEVERDLSEQLFKLRFQRSTGSMENPMKLREVRREIARVKTLIREKQGESSK